MIALMIIIGAPMSTTTDTATTTIANSAAITSMTFTGPPTWIGMSRPTVIARSCNPLVAD
ncbi:hypothetical protein ASD42_28295 [Nocardia sp. Root136]|nr:hypothetical protein ASD42_28295 [Nocardia sp. Root136]